MYLFIKPDNSFQIYQEWINQKSNIFIPQPQTLNEYINENSSDPVEILQQRLNIIRNYKLDEDKFFNDLP
jgi:hypothetical protein